MDRANRVLWIVIASLLLLIGAGGALAAAGVLPFDTATTLLPPIVRNTWHAGGIGAWIGLAALGLAVAVVGVLLIRAELRPRLGSTMPDLLLTDPAGLRAVTGGRDERNPALPAAGAHATYRQRPGRTRVRSSAMVRSIEKDLARHPKVHRVSVGLGGDATEPLVRARLDVKAGTDMAHLQRHLTESLSRFCTTTGLRPTDVRVVVSLSDRDAARVR